MDNDSEFTGRLMDMRAYPPSSRDYCLEFPEQVSEIHRISNGNFLLHKFSLCIAIKKNRTRKMPVDIKKHLSKLPAVAWWLIAKRRPLAMLSEAPARAHGLNSKVALLGTSFVAAAGLVIFIQLLGIQMFAGEVDPYGNRIAATAWGLGEATLGTVKAVAGRQSTPLALGFLPTWALIMAVALIVALLVTPLLNRRDKIKASRAVLMWAMSGNLLLLGGMAALGGLGTFGFSFSCPEADRIVLQNNASIFYGFMLAFVTVLLALALLRHKGVWLQGKPWDWIADETFSSFPAFAAIALCLYFPPRIASKFETKIEIRPLNICDVGTSRCTVALTLRNAAAYELEGDLRIQASVVDLGETDSAKRSIYVVASWVNPSPGGAAPIRLAKGEVQYAQLEVKAATDCVGLSSSKRPSDHYVSSVEFILGGYVLGSDGQAIALRRVATAEHGVARAFAKTLLASCRIPKAGMDKPSKAPQG